MVLATERCGEDAMGDVAAEVVLLVETVGDRGVHVDAGGVGLVDEPHLHVVGHADVAIAMGEVPVDVDFVEAVGGHRRFERRLAPEAPGGDPPGGAGGVSLSHERHGEQAGGEAKCEPNGRHSRRSPRHASSAFDDLSTVVVYAHPDRLCRRRRVADGWSTMLP